MSKKAVASPATKADLQSLREATQAGLEIVRHMDLHYLRGDLVREIRAEAKQTRRHFDVVVEQLFYDFRGAFGDRTSQHDDKLQNHEHRLQTVERRLGFVS